MVDPTTSDRSAGDASTTAAEPPEKRVSWAELFFDLVFVLAVTQLSAILATDHSWAGLLRALVVFVPVYWLWVGTAIQTNLRDVERPGVRVAVFGVALAAVFMALALPEAYGSRGLLYASAYWVGRAVLWPQGIATAIRGRSWPLNPVTVSLAVTGPILVVGSLFDGWPRVALWGCAAALDLASPTLLRRRLQAMHVDPGHLAERFGLFVLIALGESVVAIGGSAGAVSEVGVSVGLTVAAAFAVSCNLWWVYFHFAADAMRYSLSTARIQLDVMRLVLSYGHLSFIAAIILAAVGMHDAVVHPAEPLGWSVTGLLYGGTALYLATFGFTRWAMFRLVSTTRLTAAAVVLVLLPVAAYLPALACVAVLGVVLTLLNATELARVDHDGWRALLRRVT